MKRVGYVDTTYLMSAARTLADVKQRSYEIMGIRRGSRVLDVGCGPGTDTISLAQVAASSGLVVGIDVDAEMVAEANRRANRAGVAQSTRHVCGDAASLPYQDETFDMCRSDRMFQHLDNPQNALAEMRRVTRSGGTVVVIDTDWGSLSIDSDHVSIERNLVRVLQEEFHRNGYGARQLNRLFRGQELEAVHIETFSIFTTAYAQARQLARLDAAEAVAVASSTISQDEASRWRASLEEAARRDEFFASITIILVAGRVPARE